MLHDMNDNAFNELKETIFKYENKDYDLIENDSIPDSTRERFRKILSATFSSLESYYSSLDNK